jgi:hypothetical protein
VSTAEITTSCHAPPGAPALCTAPPGAMIKLVTVMAGLAFATVGLAGPVQADANQDQEFYQLLTQPNQKHPMVITHFPLVRSQAIASCRYMDAGQTPLQAADDLDLRYGGPFPWDDASQISSTAGVVYCPWHDQGLEANPDWAATPTPADWQPVYPPLAWDPPSPQPPREFLNP